MKPLLVNTLFVLEIQKTDFDNSDFATHDLLHLVLIYINYPHTFRTIYNTETFGRRGVFSLVTPYDDGYPKDATQRAFRPQDDSTFQNSFRYAELLRSLSPSEQFLLNKVFAASRLKSQRIADVSEEHRKSLACFN